jgi:hypothetical protein
MSDTVDLAEAVKVELAGHAFSQPFVPQRVYLPTFTLQDLANLQVTVAPASIARDNVSRAHVQVDRQVEVAVTQRVQSIDVVGVDALVGLVEEISDFLDGRTLAPAPAFLQIAMEVVPYDQEALHSKNVFAALVTLTYRVVKKP